MVVLVTGGAGFIGSALVRRLVLREQARVATLDALTYAGNLESLAEVMEHPRHHFHHADVTDGAAVRRILTTERPTCVVHLAAESHVDRSLDAPAPFVRTNVVGTATLLDEVLRYWRALSAEAAAQFRFLHVSTDEVYGSLGSTGRFTESSPYRPTSPYAASKAGADHLVRAWAHTWSFPALVTNCSNNYGPYQFPEKLIPLTIVKALAGEALPVYGAGDNVRDWLHVEDHVEALCLVLARGRTGETYLIGGDGERRNLDVVERVADLVDELAPRPRGEPPRRSLVTFVTDRPGHDHRYAIDASKLRSELGWRPERTFEQGLRDTVLWYLQHANWWHRVQSGAYRGERLGLAGEPPA